MKNKKAKFSNQTKEAIYERDWKCCIICWNNTWLQFHHAWYSQEANYWPDRNKTNQWVTICAKHHNMAHACKSGEWIREECINYLKNL